MRTLFTIGCLLTSAWLFAAPANTDPFDAATEAKTNEAALERYAKPGAVIRYKKLIESLSTPLEELGPPARNLHLPVRSYPDGRPETTVKAEEAWITLDTTYMRGRQVLVTQYNKDGTVNSVLTADEIAVDRTKMLAVAKGRIRGTMNGDRLDGVGAIIDLDAKYLRIVKRAIIHTKRMGDVNVTDRGIF